MGRLERGVPRPDIHVSEHYTHLVASIDYVKSERHRDAFIRHAPDLVIVDEAHTAARPRGQNAARSQQQRHNLLKDLAKDPNRHILLATATPHSGVEEGFRSLIGLLDEDLDLPPDQDLPRRNLLPHLVQRRRSDLSNWLGETTPFPERDNQERTYFMSSEYTRLYESILQFCRETVSDSDGRRRRVRYWAAIAILRCVLSSPAAAEATLGKRAERRRGQTSAEFASQILDIDSDQDSPPDYAPTSVLDTEEVSLNAREIRRLEDLLRRARELNGPDRDAKLAETARAIDEMLSEGFRPIVYCRFIDTANYVADQLQRILESRYPGLRAQSVTGGDGNDEQRREIIAELTRSPLRVLVATDCLSEGINLQEHFDAVLHYDLPWNPNRLEQREGRVDRYGQQKSRVKAVLLWGEDNAIDRAVLRVLIRKAREIRDSLGISISAPVESDAVIQAVIEDVFMQRGGYQLALVSDDDGSDTRVSEYHDTVDNAAERESRNRAYFAQRGIKPDQVQRELREMEPALGSASDILTFIRNAIQRFNGELRPVG
ncbi:MAG: helicase-related protein, partial [Dehalococcoidia bacterium]|nr:helicase-related protein [Dehalococcoidia bacterium]